MAGCTTAGLAQAAPATSAVNAGTISGAVLDAASGQPLGRAEVVLNPGALTGSRGVVTDDAGRYRFDHVAAGAYRLNVRHLGYRPATIEIDLRDTSALRVSIGLEVQPILLEAMPVEAVTPLLGLSARSGAEARRVDAERSRQERYLTGDVRGLTGADAVEAITLGETDVLRAFQRMPGVSTRDDFTAHLWTRGARWSETRVYLDGLPLFNPVHAAGAFSAIHPDMVGSAFFHPGVRSAALGEGAAAALELSSRTAADTTWAGSAELSVISGRAAVDRRFGEGRTGFMLAARRSYMDLVTAAGTDSSGAVPYAFHDLGARLDLPVGRAALEASVLWEHDLLRGSLPDILSRNRGYWGNVLGQVSLITLRGPWEVRHSVGISRLFTHLRLVSGDSSQGVPSHEPVDNTITYVAARGELAPVSSAGNGWWAGYEVVRQSLEYLGGPPTPHARTAAIGGLYRGGDSARGPEALGEFRLQGALTVVALWGEGRWTLRQRLTAQAGARVEVGHAVRNARGVRVAPRIMVRYRPAAGLSVTTGWGRSFQYTQTIAPTGPRIGPDLHVTDVWLLAGDSVPAMRADVVTAGLEYWIGGGWLGAVNAYTRHATGVTEPDPTPGGLTTARPPFVVASTRARGLELSLRRLVGPLTLSLAYSRVRAESQASGFTYPAAGERRQVLDATVMMRVASGLRLGGAITTASGTPFTRYYSQPHFGAQCDTIIPGCRLTSGDIPSFVEEPNAARAPAYATADLLADWTWARRGWELGAYLQLRNVFNWRNANTYLGSERSCTLPESPGTVIPRPGICDRFDRGLPLLPLAGVRVAF